MSKEIKLSRQEENLIKLVRSVPEGSIKEIRIKDGQPVTAEEIKMKINFGQKTICFKDNGKDNLKDG
jgi:hypothetical protein